MARQSEISVSAQVLGIKVPLERPSGQYGNDDPELIELEQQVSEGRKNLVKQKKRDEFLQGQVAALTYMIERGGVDGPGQSGAPV